MVFDLPEPFGPTMAEKDYMLVSHFQCAQSRGRTL